MNAQPSPTGSRQIAWPSVVTVISAAILIGAEVFGAAFAGDCRPCSALGAAGVRAAAPAGAGILVTSTGDGTLMGRRVAIDEAHHPIRRRVE